MLPLILTENVNVLRRANSTTASRDSFNNPVYGTPTTWNAFYSNIKVRVSLTGKRIKWGETGEMIHPQGILYFSTQYTILPEDRLVILSSAQGITTGVEYIVTAVWPATLLPAGNPDHFQAEIQLPQ